MAKSPLPFIALCASLVAILPLSSPAAMQGGEIICAQSVLADRIIDVCSTIMDRRQVGGARAEREKLLERMGSYKENYKERTGAESDGGMFGELGESFGERNAGRKYGMGENVDGERRMEKEEVLRALEKLGENYKERNAWSKDSMGENTNQENNRVGIQEKTEKLGEKTNVENNKNKGDKLSGWKKEGEKYKEINKNTGRTYALGENRYEENNQNTGAKKLEENSPVNYVENAKNGLGLRILIEKLKKQMAGEKGERVEENEILENKNGWERENGILERQNNGKEGESEVVEKENKHGRERENGIVERENKYGWERENGEENEENVPEKLENLKTKDMEEKALIKFKSKVEKELKELEILESLFQYNSVFHGTPGAKSENPERNERDGNSNRNERGGNSKWNERGGNLEWNEEDGKSKRNNGDDNSKWNEGDGNPKRNKRDSSNLFWLFSKCCREGCRDADFEFLCHHLN